MMISLSLFLFVVASAGPCLVCLLVRRMRIGGIDRVANVFFAAGCVEPEGKPKARPPASL